MSPLKRPSSGSTAGHVRPPPGKPSEGVRARPAPGADGPEHIRIIEKYCSSALTAKQEQSVRSAPGVRPPTEIIFLCKISRVGWDGKVFCQTSPRPDLPKSFPYSGLCVYGLRLEGRLADSARNLLHDGNQAILHIIYNRGSQSGGRLTFDVKPT